MFISYPIPNEIEVALLLFYPMGLKLTSSVVRTAYGYSNNIYIYIINIKFHVVSFDRPEKPPAGRRPNLLLIGLRVPYN
jgi:hypothetical protein